MAARVRTVSQRDKQAVAESFSKAASSYDSVAELQRSVGTELIAMLRTVRSSADLTDCLVDLGSGTGFFTEMLARHYPDAHTFGLDIAHGMLHYAQGCRSDRLGWFGGDMESMPLATGSVSIFFSSLAVQWCENLPAFFTEVERCLMPNGILALATLGPQTLFELRDSWRQVDEYTHVNEFVAIDHVRKLASDSGLQEIEVQQAPRVMHYPSLRELTHELKALGAHNVNHQRAPGLTGPAKIKKLRDCYEHYRTLSGLPASYQVCWLLLGKG